MITMRNIWILMQACDMLSLVVGLVKFSPFLTALFNTWNWKDSVEARYLRIHSA